MTVLDKQWLVQNGDVLAGGSEGGDGEDVRSGSGEKMEEGEEERKGGEVMDIRDVTDTQFTVELGSGNILRCTLPPVYAHTQGTCMYVYTIMPGSAPRSTKEGVGLKLTIKFWHAKCIQ